ncbi:MAG: iron ABC transporter permease [Betaproteobacteria bacterium]|nr:iron ABC transporter permease [Betaproteobacteria bacterium]
MPPLRSLPRSHALLPLAAGVALVMLLVSLMVGRYPLSLADIASLLWAQWSATPTAHSTASAVLFDIRIPRVAMTFAVGVALSAAGAAYQNLFRNPLVSPDLLGVSSGAALGAMLGIFFALPLPLIQALAFAGGLLAVAIVYAIGVGASRQRMHDMHDPLLVLVLTGVVISALLAAGTALIKYLADPYNQLPAMTYWLLGSFAAITSHDAATAIPIMLVALLPLWLLRWRINLLSLPDDEARTLGLNVRGARLVIIVAATLMTATAVATCGIIGWVGLVVPQMVRLLAGAEFSRLLPLTMLLGGSFMLAVDTLGRTLVAVEIPPGVLTALVGAPLFLWLLVSRRGP